jgi:peptide deformylase
VFKIILNEQTPNLPAMEERPNGELLNRFFDFAKRQHAVGLASNQVSYNGDRIQERFCAVNTKDGWTMAIDPSIPSESGKQETCHEGCLTWPSKLVVALRSPTVNVQYTDLNGEVQTRVAQGVEAQIWQHEINHLNGVEEELISKDFRSYKRTEAKVGRNDPCPCNSGRKYKKCCA